MRPTYKRIKVDMPHCPKCGEQLKGVNSSMFPYKCSCGIWKQNYMTLEFTIKPLK